jgi:hypothetical protein
MVVSSPLTPSPYLPVANLAACFNNTNSTYKFYWFLALLQSVEQGKNCIRKQDLFAQMLAQAWYTVHYFKVSFGSQDLIQQAAQSLRALESIPIDAPREKVIALLSGTRQSASLRQLNHFDKNVPHWFLSPWFPKHKGENDPQQRHRIYSQSQAFSNQVLYALFPDRIEINPIWLPYLESNVRLLKDFCYWNLTQFLQARNPQVPDLANKLIKPATRNSLSPQRRDFWDKVLNDLGPQSCIYTGKPLEKGNYAVEHFIPYRFVSHDLMWNLIPADPSFNSRKSDKLPPLNRYFDGFYRLQSMAVLHIQKVAPRNRFLQDYLTLFPQIDAMSGERFREQLSPLLSIAHNNGFEYLETA